MLIQAWAQARHESNERAKNQAGRESEQSITRRQLGKSALKCARLSHPPFRPIFSTVTGFKPFSHFVFVYLGDVVTHVHSDYGDD